LKYRDGYKYQLWEDEKIYLPDIVLEDGTILKAPRGLNIETMFIRLMPDGTLIGKSGYAWDGASGPTWDSKYCMRGPLFHDIGYQLIRERLLSLAYKHYFDALMYLIIRTDGYKMVESWDHPAIFQMIEKKWIKDRIWAWYQAVYNFGRSAALPENDRKILEVPSWNLSANGLKAW
jgi:hypothetical protein